MSIYVEPATNLSEGWIRTLNLVHAAGGHAINVMSTVSDPLAPETPVIREAIDAVLVDGHRAGTRIQSIDTVAGTIFPSDLYASPDFAYDPNLSANDKLRLDTSASDLYRAYADMLPVLCTDRANGRGT